MTRLLTLYLIAERLLLDARATEDRDTWLLDSLVDSIWMVLSAEDRHTLRPRKNGEEDNAVTIYAQSAQVPVEAPAFCGGYLSWGGERWWSAGLVRQLEERIQQLEAERDAKP